MRYLITCNDGSFDPFLTKWFDPENNFDDEVGMVVFDLNMFSYTTNGTDWKPIHQDHL